MIRLPVGVSYIEAVLGPVSKVPKQFRLDMQDGSLTLSNKISLKGTYITMKFLG